MESPPAAVAPCSGTRIGGSEALIRRHENGMTMWLKMCRLFTHHGALDSSLAVSCLPALAPFRPKRMQRAGDFMKPRSRAQISVITDFSKATASASSSHGSKVGPVFNAKFSQLCRKSKSRGDSQLYLSSRGDPYAGTRPLIFTYPAMMDARMQLQSVSVCMWHGARPWR